MVLSGCGPETGSGARASWKLTFFYHLRKLTKKGTDRVDYTQIPQAAILKPSGWLPEVRLGGG